MRRNGSELQRLASRKIAPQNLREEQLPTSADATVPVAPRFGAFGGRSSRSPRNLRFSLRFDASVVNASVRDGRFRFEHQLSTFV
jgi:hypothetical protein